MRHPTLKQNVRFNGPNYDPEKDKVRLTGQMLRIFEYMRYGDWTTLDEISRATDDPHASVSAQLRHLRKDRFGGHEIEKRRRGDDLSGLWEYRLIENKKIYEPKKDLFDNTSPQR